jgi:hypothetical protein
LNSWVLLLIPAVALFAWYWLFWRKFNPTSTRDELNPPLTNDQILAGYKLTQTGNKRYIKRASLTAVKKKGARTAGQKSAGRKKSLARKKSK